MAGSTSHTSSDRGRVRGQMSWPANQSHLAGENKQHCVGPGASALYSVLVAEVDVFFFSIIRLGPGEPVTSAFVPRLQTGSGFSFYLTHQQKR